MGSFGPWGWFPLMWIGPLIFFVILLVLLFRGGGWPVCSGHGSRDREDTAREILDRRYARGEINQEEYQSMRKELE